MPLPLVFARFVLKLVPWGARHPFAPRFHRAAPQPAKGFVSFPRAATARTTPAVPMELGSLYLPQFRFFMTWGPMRFKACACVWARERAHLYLRDITSSSRARVRAAGRPCALLVAGLAHRRARARAAERARRTVDERAGLHERGHEQARARQSGKAQLGHMRKLAHESSRSRSSMDAVRMHVELRSHLRQFRALCGISGDTASIPGYTRAMLDVVCPDLVGVTEIGLSSFTICSKHAKLGCFRRSSSKFGFDPSWASSAKVGSILPECGINMCFPTSTKFGPTSANFGPT